MTEFDKGWNAALKAAADAVVQAPVFPKNVSNVLLDAQLITILSLCRKKVETLTRDGQ